VFHGAGTKASFLRVSNVVPLQYVLYRIAVIPSASAEFCSVAVTLILESVISLLASDSSMCGCRVARS
jgi:hypothetical protein